MAEVNLLCPDYYLPSEVIDNILSHLPIKDAVRTCALSSKWVFKSHTMSKLVFDNACLPPAVNRGRDYQLSKLVNIIDSVLSLHVGPIHRFELSANLQPSSADIDRWIILLWRNHIKEIVLKFPDGEPYRVPTRLFSCAELTYLELQHCDFNPSATFSRLMNLVSLVLAKVSDPGGRIEALISSCPLLNFLSLDAIKGCHHLRICAPRLEDVRITNTYFDISIDNSPSVTTAIFTLEDRHRKRQLDQRVYGIKLAMLICCLPNVRELQLTQYSIQWLFSDAVILGRLPGNYDHLKELSVHIDFNSDPESKAALCLFRSFPNLEVLQVMIDSEKLKAHRTKALSWEPEEQDFMFTCLHDVEISDMIGSRQELNLIKSILATAPVLRSITISIASNEKVMDESKIFVELMRYQRASPVAEIIYWENPVL